MSDDRDSQQRKIRKAVIPAAGFGTRLFPATKAIRKGFFPIVDRQGRAKPVILAIVEEALMAGIESVGIVVQPEDQPAFTEFFQALPEGDYFDKLAVKHAAYLEYLQGIGERVVLLTQPRQDGFGHAVFCAQDWVNQEPFLLLLGDHVYLSDTEESCAKQIVDVFEQTGKSVVGVEAVLADGIAHRGCVTGVWREPNRILEISQIYEKPTVDYARQHLHIAGMPADQLLAIFGLYALMPEVFDYLADRIQHNLREQGEFQLTSCLDELQKHQGMVAYLVKGRSFDTGLPDAYRQAVIEFRGSL